MCMSDTIINAVQCESSSSNLAFFWEKKLSSNFIFSYWSLFCLLQDSIWQSFPPCQKDSHSTSSTSTVGQIIAYKRKWKWKEKLKSMDSENLLHFEGIQSERRWGKFMFQAGSGIKSLPAPAWLRVSQSQCQTKETWNFSTSFSPCSLTQLCSIKFLTMCCRQNRKTYSLSVLSAHS